MGSFKEPCMKLKEQPYKQKEINVVDGKGERLEIVKRVGASDIRQTMAKNLDFTLKSISGHWRV